MEGLRGRTEGSDPNLKTTRSIGTEQKAAKPPHRRRSDGRASDSDWNNPSLKRYPFFRRKYKMTSRIQKITPFLWFDHQAEEAAQFYTSIFKNSKVKGVSRYGEGTPGPAGSVMTVAFELDGQE